MSTDAIEQEQLVRAARERIFSQVKWLVNEPDGLLHERRSGMHRILVLKEGHEIRLHFSHSALPGSERMSGRMSELDLSNPLFPFAPYTQGMMLTLLWRDSPKRVYTIGFGAGRVPTILHAHVPDLMLESTEIDADILPVAQRYFGYIPDVRQQVVIQDGREYLTRRPPGTKYDFIHVDAFKGFGHTPFLLGTREFYDLCRKRLTDGGVVCTNLVASDPLFRVRVNTMSASFQHSYLFVHEDATVLYGTDAPRLNPDECSARGKAIQNRYLFAFPFDQLAAKLEHVDACQSYLRQFADDSSVLSDDSPPPELSTIPKEDPMFFDVGRNDQCPCGSGKKFKKCHGR